MAPRGAASARLGDFQDERNLPCAETGPGAVGQLGTVGGMRFVANPAGSSFAVVDHMEVVEIAVAVTKFRIDGRIGEAEQILLVALEAEVIAPLCIGGVEGRRVCPFQQSKITGTMGIVTPGATPQQQWAVKILLPLQLCADVLERGQLGVAMTAQAELHFIRTQQILDLGGMGIVTISAPPRLTQRFVQVRHLGESILESLVTVKAEIRHLVLGKGRPIRAVRVVTGHTA